MATFADQGSESFSGLIADISAFLLSNPDQAESLHAAFKAEGFSLPISRLAGQTRSKRYVSVFVKAVHAGKWILSWIGGKADSTKTLLEKAKSTRDELLRLAQTLDRRPPGSSMRRRWFAQRRRSIYNRLLYLLPKAEYRTLLEQIPEIDEFHEVRAVASAIVEGDATKILSYPGRIVSTFCQLWPEHHGSKQPTLMWPKEPGRPEGDAIANVALRLSVNPTDAVLERVGKIAPGARILIDLCTQSNADRKLISDLTYLDEMEHLFRGVPHFDIQSMLRNRFDESEESGLEALALGGGDYFTPWHFPDYAG